MKKIIFFSSSLVILFSTLNFNNISLAIDPVIKAPENFDEAKKVGEKTIDIAKNDLPTIVKNIWQNEIRPIWKRLWDILNDWFGDAWRKVKNIFEKELQKREPLIKEEFQKEKTEMKEDIKTEVPAATKSIWQKVKEILQ